jgi:hypothetical protein
MKKFLFAVLASTALFTACDPMKDVYKELDANTDKVTTGVDRVEVPTEYTLTEEDYAAIGGEVASGNSFSDATPVADNLPAYLLKKFSDVAVYKEIPASHVVAVSYDFNRDNKLGLDEVEFPSFGPEYKMTADDYESVDQGKHDNFAYYHSDAEIDSMINIVLKTNFPSAEAEDVQIVYYMYYDNGTNEVSRVFKFDGTKWVQDPDFIVVPAEERFAYSLEEGMGYRLEPSDYKAMGVSGFSSSANPENYIPTFLSSKLPYAQKGEKMYIKYNFDGSEEVAQFAFDGMQWVKTPAFEIEARSDKFEYTGEAFSVIEATIIELTEADYALTGDDKYKNFGYYDDQAGTYNGEAVENVMHAKIFHILDTNYAAEVGQKFLVSYKYYSYGTHDMKIKVQKTAEGWVVL